VLGFNVLSPAVLPQTLKPITMVLPWLWSPSPRHYRGFPPHYRSITASFSESFPVPAGITAVVVTESFSTRELRCYRKI